jgi:2'-5' RNA ligase
MLATETAVIVPVPDAEPVVAVHRRQLDRAASWGVPAHVTVLYPFLSPSDIDRAALARLGAALASVPEFEFSRCDWFGEDVLWLAPEPDKPFRALTGAVWGAFPQHPPYAGAYSEVVPHLTVGERQSGSTSALRAAEAAVQVALPVRALINRAVLIAGTREPGSWRTVQEFWLAGVTTV